MSKTLRDLLCDDKKPKPASSPTPAPSRGSSTAGDHMEQQSSPEKEEKSAESLAGEKDLPVNEAAVAADCLLNLKQEVTSISHNESKSPQKSSHSLEQEGSQSNEKSSEFIVMETAEVTENSLETKETEVPKPIEKSLDSEEKKGSESTEDPSNSLETESSKSPEKSTVPLEKEIPKSTEKSSNFPKKESSEMSEKPSDSAEKESSKPVEKCQDSLEKKEISELSVKPSDSAEKGSSKPVEKCQDSLEKKETSKPEESSVKQLVSLAEVTGGRSEKVKKVVRVQCNENVPDGASVPKHAVLKPCPSVGMNLENFDTNNVSPGIRSNCGHQVSSESGVMMDEAWEILNRSYVYFKGTPVGTIAATDTSAEILNYNQVFVRDFVPCGLACLMKEPAEPEIVKNFLLKTLHLQGWEKRIDNFTLGEGVMPASFKVLYDSHRQKETLVADFGGSAIGRVAPIDSGFWWIILLRSYTKCTRDYTLAELPEVQRGMKLILNLCLSDGFDTFPTLLCADGCSMIDRRMGIYGYPIEIQALFYFALRCARQMLKPERDGKELIERIDKRITALSYHIQKYYWLDFTQLNNIYRYKTEEYSHTAVNKFNVIPESIPDWLFDFMPLRGGYLIGNVSPARMDFRWFLVGNCIAILSSLTTPAQATAIMDLVEERWEDLIGEMPLKITYPALEGHEWRIVTGFDPKNTRWSYHNGGSWPVLLWLLTAACIKTGRPQIAKRAIELVELRLSKDGWPEYYDGKTGRYVGKQARKYQTWSIAGYLVAKMMIENPSNLLMISLEEDKKINKPRLTRSTSF